MKERPIVLVIDDEPGLRDMLAYELSMEGFGVETVDSGPAALAALRRRRFDVAITDLKMPGMDGIQTVEALRKIDPELEVIVATGYATVETAVACMKRGAYDYIHKPYDVIELKALLEKAMEKSHLSGLVGLYEASSAVLATLKSTDLVSLVVELAHRVLKGDAVALALPSGDGAPVVHTHPAGADVSVSLVNALVAQANAAGSSTRAEGDARFPAALVYPLGARSRAVGHLLVLRSGDQPSFAPSELTRGDVFANQIALALDNASLHEELGHKVDELVRTREQLVQVEKLSLAGQMAQSVAHEVNNPLSLVRVNLGALRDYSDHIGAMWLAARAAAEYLRRLPDDDAGRLARDLWVGDEMATDGIVRELGPMVTEIVDGVRRISDMVAGFQRLAAAPLGGPSTSGPVDLGRVLEECVGALGAAQSSVLLDASLHGGPPVSASADDLRTGLVNLLTHAISPVRKRTAGGIVTVRLERDPGLARLIIHDETLCMSADEQRTLFDPRLEVNTSRGRTLRLNVELAMAYQLLARNGARISVQPSAPQGVTFEVSFPLAS